MTTATKPLTRTIVDLKPLEPSVIRRAVHSLLRAKWPLLALVILGSVVIMALFAGQISPRDPNRQSLRERLYEPLYQDEVGQIQYFLGTDGLGRDLWSRIIHGAQVSLAVGVMAVAVGGILGTTLGIVAGYRGGWVDDFIMRLADIQLAFPFILLAIMVLVVLGPGVWNLVPVLGIGQWVTYARIARGQTISQREKEYVEAARSIGAGDLRIMLQAILPNVVAPLIVIASFNVASAILAEASLSFLGLGVPPTVPTWGGILNESRDQILAGKWWPAFFPGLAIMLTVLSLNILGDWLRDFLDPRLHGK